MKIKLVTCFQHQRQHEYGHQQLIRSLRHFGYDYHVIDPQPYRWFGDKLIGAAAYVETIREDYTHFLFLDGNDTFAVGPMEEVISIAPKHEILISCEKALWPHTAEKYRGNYPENGGRWKFINSGSYLAPIDLFLEMWSEHPVPFHYDDQLWFHERYNETPGNFIRDLNCSVFQSVAFRAEDEFTTGGSRVHNRITGTLPIFIHNNGGNASNPMDWVYNLI